MTIPQAGAPASLRPLRLWPAVAVALVMVLGAVALPFVPGGGLSTVIGGVVGGLLVLLWWLFFSNAPWPERLGVVALMIVALLAASRLVHQSVSNGLMGAMLFIFGLPVLSLALVFGAVISRRRSPGARRTTTAVAIVLASGGFTLVRTGGITGDVRSDLHWRLDAHP